MPVAAKACGLRKGRYSEVGHIYLLTAVVHERQSVFSDWKLGRLLVEQMRAANDEGMVKSLAFVVMPDHLHWLVELRRGTLAALMCRVKSRSCRSINLKRNSQGRLWQRGYHERALRREENLKSVARYIVMNPLRAGLVQRLGDYPLWDAVWI
ncbi:REP element-mobilizing transposase RayT [Pseudomonas helmanticensis]|uniref:REP element-mobilizing transposase RayT n=1 Tax=Pseudomonas helmanticensis TaxID=1471381 RepID=A0ACD2TZX7_9PSED|nr:transposase [Pseudomonas helmanticensis]SMQ22578.1 REP element-mobilizing transposase RayT [Pseudomonas helmanticensis]